MVQTSWALLGLMAAGCTDTDALRRGAEFLRSRQLPSGGAKTALFEFFPMFVPSLSWQNDALYLKMAQKDRFLTA
eukprot:COSAG06_NODE_3307_length_5528_cov_105.042918_1_plen_75_part_00